MNDDILFAKKHPFLNILIGILIVIIIFGIGIAGFYICIRALDSGLTRGMNYLQRIAQNTDKAVIVALITGGISILGILISSTIGKIYEYRYNMNREEQCYIG